MAKFHSLKVQDIYKETKDCSVISLEIPEDLKEAFQFQQGQHLTLKANIDGEEVRRSYSLCSSPTENQWKVAVKKVSGGLFSNFVHDKIKKGDQLEVMTPSGKFFKEIFNYSDSEGKI